jgi:malonate transporter
MSEIVQLTLPIFGVMALGWMATRTRLTPPAALDALSAFAFRFALPALVFRLISSQPLAGSLNPLFYGGYLLGGSLVFALAFLLSRIVDRRAVATAGARATAATVSNLGFLGPPLMLAFFGDRGAGPLAMAILAEIMVLLSVGAVIMSTAQNVFEKRGAGRPGQPGPARSLASAAHMRASQTHSQDGNRAGIGSLVLRGTILNPVVMAILLGVALAATGRALPGPLDGVLAFLGSAAGPTALFALGGALAIQHIDRGTILSAVGITAAKLVVYPALVWLVLAHLLRIEPFWVQSGVLMAALPTAGNVYVVAQRYTGDHADQVSAVIVLSTLASVATVPLVATLILT